MNNEVDKEMKRCLLLLVCAVLVFALGWFFIRCSTVGIMSFKSRGIYPVEKLDSICEANSIPRNLELWRQTNFQLDDGMILRRYTFIETLSGDSIKESIFTIDLFDSTMVFHHKQVK